MENPIGVGIIGCGVIAPSHIDSYLAVPGVAITALCDCHPDALQKLRTRYPDIAFNCYLDAADLLADPRVQAVSICTDHASHASLFREAVAAGKHVICEKALSVDNASLQEMVDIAASAPVVCAGIFQHRFERIYANVKAILASGQLGVPLTLSAWHNCYRSDHYYQQDAWRGTWAGEGGSLMINQSIHFLDILQWIGGGVQSIHGQIANRCHQGVIKTEDTAVAVLRFISGALGTYCASSASNREWTYGFRIVGSMGELEIRDGELVQLSHRDAQLAPLLQQQICAIEDEADIEAGKDYYGKGHAAQIRDFINAIREQRRPKVTIADAAEAVRLVLAIYRTPNPQCPAPGGA